MRLLVALLMVLALVMPALAVRPDEMLDDPALEARARTISAELRCLVCQNQSIDDSEADLARDLRVIVRERLVAGDSDPEVLDYIVARYGEYVLLRPVLAPHTLLLWIAGPAALLIGIAAVAVGVSRRRRQTTDDTAALTDEEQAALDELRSQPQR